LKVEGNIKNRKSQPKIPKHVMFFIYSIDNTIKGVVDKIITF